MNINFVFLWTDVLLWLLVAIITSFILYARNKPHLRAPWHHVMQNRLGVISFVVLLAFICVALLDSIHFQYEISHHQTIQQSNQHQVRSVLDTLLSPLGDRLEKTYSQPFASHLYMKMTHQLPDGNVVRDYPRLEYAAVGLDDKSTSIQKDILNKILLATAWGLGIAIIFRFVLQATLKTKYQLSWFQVWKAVKQRQTRLPWRAIWYTATVIIVLTCIALTLSSDYHIFGTDKVGNDVFYITIKSIRTGLIIGTLTTLVILPFAVLLGTMAGYFGGLIDDLVQYVYTTLSSIPGVLLIAAAILSLQIYISNHPDHFETLLERADARLLSLCFILGITSWTSLCRILRAETLKLRELDFVFAAKTLGVKNFKIISRHIIPNVMHIIVITLILDFSALVLAEAVLSYVGVGVDPTTQSWGNMINSARLEMAREPVVWWPLLSAFVFMFVLVLAANLFSDAVRDAFDPRSQSGHDLSD